MLRLGCQAITFAHIRSHHWISIRSKVRPAVTFTYKQSLEIGVITLRSRHEWLIFMHTCVCANVSSEQPGSGEGLATCWAHTGESVWANVHLQGPQACVLLGAVFAMKGWSRRDFGGQRRRLLHLCQVGELVVGQCWEAVVTVTAVQAVVDVLDDIWARGIWGTAAILLLLLAAAVGWRTAEVQGAQWRRRRGHGCDRGKGCGQRVRTGGVAGQGRAALLCWKFSPWKAFRDKSWEQRGN